MIILKKNQDINKNDKIPEIISRDKFDAKENNHIKKQIKKNNNKKYNFENNNISSKLNFNNIYEKRNNPFLNHATTNIDDKEGKKNENVYHRNQLSKKNEDNIIKKIENKLCIYIFYCFANQKKNK